MAVALSACSNSPMQVLEDYVAQRSNRNPKLYELKSIEKIDGLKGNVFGQERYEIVYEASFVSKEELYFQVSLYSPDQVELTSFDNLAINTSECYEADTIVFSSTPYREGYRLGQVKGLSNETLSIFRRLPKGTECFKVEGKEVLKRTDNGWKVN